MSESSLDAATPNDITGVAIQSLGCQDCEWFEVRALASRTGTLHRMRTCDAHSELADRKVLVHFMVEER